MLDQAKPAIVWAFVENNRHLEIAQACAPRKIHLVFEKPLASVYNDALGIRDLARKHGIQVMTNYQMAWWLRSMPPKPRLIAATWAMSGACAESGERGAVGPEVRTRRIHEKPPDRSGGFLEGGAMQPGV
jgi:hypothetical protein